MTNRRTAIDRALAVLARLMEAPSNVYDLAADYGVSLKTIRRDVAAIRRAGFVVAEDFGVNGVKVLSVLCVRSIKEQRP